MFPHLIGRIALERCHGVVSSVEGGAAEHDTEPRREPNGYTGYDTQTAMEVDVSGSE